VATEEEGKPEKDSASLGDKGAVRCWWDVNMEGDFEELPQRDWVSEVWTSFKSCKCFIFPPCSARNSTQLELWILILPFGLVLYVKWNRMPNSFLRLFVSFLFSYHNINAMCQCVKKMMLTRRLWNYTVSFPSILGNKNQLSSCLTLLLSLFLEHFSGYMAACHDPHHMSLPGFSQAVTFSVAFLCPL
jgi:hypothetical protein